MSFNKAKVLKSAEKYVQQGKIPSAIDEYRKIVEADPNDLTMINTLGDLCVRAGRTEEAIMNFSRIAENYRENGFTLKAIAMYKKISKLEPSNYETSLKLADLYSKQGLIVDARQQYLLVADAYKKTGQTRQALEVLKKIADLDPENTSVRLKLAESYQVENMYDEAHEAYIAAGQEFLKKGKVSDAIQSYQKAVSINPDSKSAIKAMIDALLQQGDLDQALEMLGSALDKNPGDVDLIVLLGRTYLNGKMLSEAEETFSRLLELDKSRYDYLIEVGKRYLEKGQFDSTINTVDKCVDLLIARRQEEKAINLLRGIIDYDANHMTALKRLSDIYLRVREDYNLAATLNTIAEVAMRRGMKDDAIEALKQLAEIEPDEPSHKQRLASLGVTQSISYTPPPAFTDFGQPVPAELPKQVVAPPERFSTSPLSFPQTEMQLAEKQLREAEMFASRGYADHAAELLDDLINRHPDYIDARLKLRQIYVDGGLEEKASLQCMELARLYEAKGDKAASSAMVSEAYKLNPSLSGSVATNNGPTTFGNEFAVEIDLSGNITDVGVGAEGADYQMPAYQPSAFTQMPNDLFSSPTPMPSSFEQASQPPTSFEALFSASPTSTSAPPPAQISVKGAVSGDEMKSFEINFNDEAPSTAHLAKDKILRDELEGVDFYIAQGYLDIARDTLENLDKQYPNHPAILQRFEKLGISSQAAASVPEVPMEELPESAILESTKANDFGFELKPAPPSIPQVPTSSAFGGMSGFDSLVSDIESALDDMPTSDIIPLNRQASSSKQETRVEDLSMNVSDVGESLDAGLLSIFDEFKRDLEPTEVPDFETHYNLGLAYKDMELYDDAIEEFQTACKATSPNNPDGRYFNCCNMLGFCFMQNNMARPAAVWYKRGLDSPNRSDEEYQAMRYDLGSTYEVLGEFDKALELFHEVYAIDINYRNVSAKIRELRSRLEETNNRS